MLVRIHFEASISSTYFQDQSSIDSDTEVEEGGHFQPNSSLE